MGGRLPREAPSIDAPAFDDYCTGEFGEGRIAVSIIPKPECENLGAKGGEGSEWKH